jgi:SAM-dependent methyltransferase
MATHHAGMRPSAWVRRWACRLEPGCAVLDLACGHGRHAKFFADLGHPVLAVDRDAQALADLRLHSRVEALQADLEEKDWPLRDRRFGGIVVTNYLHRPLFPLLLDALAEDGVLIYETFSSGNARFGKPSNPAFLLERGELFDLVRERLHVSAFEDVFVDQPQPAMVQRICACTAQAFARSTGPMNSAQGIG